MPDTLAALKYSPAINPLTVKKYLPSSIVIALVTFALFASAAEPALRQSCIDLI